MCKIGRVSEGCAHTLWQQIVSDFSMRWRKRDAGARFVKNWMITRFKCVLCDTRVKQRHMRAELQNCVLSSAATAGQTGFDCRVIRQ